MLSFMHPHKSFQNDTTNFSQWYSQIYYNLNTAILEKSHRIFCGSQKVLKKVRKMIVRIIYISRVRVITIQKLFPIFTNVLISSGTNFVPKTIKYVNFAYSCSTVVRLGFVETLRKIWCKRNSQISYVLHTVLVHKRFSKFFFSLHCHNFCHFCSTKENLIYLT